MHQVRRILQMTEDELKKAALNYHKACVSVINSTLPESMQFTVKCKHESDGSQYIIDGTRQHYDKCTKCGEFYR